MREGLEGVGAVIAALALVAAAFVCRAFDPAERVAVAAAFGDFTRFALFARVGVLCDALGALGAFAARFALAFLVDGFA